MRGVKLSFLLPCWLLLLLFKSYETREIPSVITVNSTVTFFVGGTIPQGQIDVTLEDVHKKASLQEWKNIEVELKHLANEMQSHGLTQLKMMFYVIGSVQKDKQRNEFNGDQLFIAKPDALPDGTVADEIKLQEQFYQVMDAISGGQHEVLASHFMSVMKKVAHLTIPTDLMENFIRQHVNNDLSPVNEQSSMANGIITQSEQQQQQQSVVESLQSKLPSLPSLPPLTSLPLIGQLFVLKDSPVKTGNSVQEDVQDAEGQGAVNMINQMKMNFNFNFQFTPPPPPSTPPPPLEKLHPRVLSSHEA